MEIDNSKNRTVLNQVARLGDQKYPSFELRVILAYLVSEGHFAWCQQLMTCLSLSKSELELPFISSHQALEGLERVIDEFYRTGLGCDIASGYQLSDLGAVGASLASTETLAEAMEVTQAYYDLIGSFTDIVNIADEKTFTNRLIDVSKLNPKVLHFLFELTFTGMVVLSEALSGQKINIQTIRFTAQLNDKERSYYQKLFSCKIEDQAKFNEWVISGETLLIPVLRKSSSSEEAEQDLKLLLEELSLEQGLVDDIDCILKGSLGDFPDPEMISHALGMSSRTLRRKLNKMGTSFRGLMDKIRCQLAINLIQHKNLSNEVLAEELGYSDAANFCNAFKKWTGHNPAYYRV